MFKLTRVTKEEETSNTRIDNILKRLRDIDSRLLDLEASNETFRNKVLRKLQNRKENQEEAEEVEAYKVGYPLKAYARS